MNVHFSYFQLHCVRAPVLADRASTILPPYLRNFDALTTSSFRCFLVKLDPTTGLTEIYSRWLIIHEGAECHVKDAESGRPAGSLQETALFINRSIGK